MVIGEKYQESQKFSLAALADPNPMSWRSASRLSGKKAEYMKKGPAKRQSYLARKRTGYSTVARTRGVYSRGEMKYFDTERSATALTAAAAWAGTEFPPNVGTPTSLCIPTVGAAINQRIGRAVHVYKIKVRGQINIPNLANQTAGLSAANVRLLLVQDMQTNGAQAQGEDIMTAPTGATAILAVDTYQSLANFGRFRVLKDKTIMLQNPNAAYDGTNIEVFGLQKPFKFNIRFKRPVCVRFNATNGGTIADIVDNSWCIYANCSNIGLAPTISYAARVCYKEQ